MTEDAGAGGSWKAPYMSYETLTNFFEKKIGTNPLPPRIDTHFLDNYAGSVRPQIIATLKTIGMLGENNEVLEPLRIAAQGADSRKKVLREWGQGFYSVQIELAGNHGTAQMLWETFSKHKYSGSTLRKAVVFYLALSEEVGLPVSAHFRAPKAVIVKSKPGGRSKPAVEDVTDDDEGTHDVSRRGGAGEERVIELGDAGTVTINVDVRWLDLPDETFVKLRRLVRELTDLSQASAGDQPADNTSDGG